MPFNKRSFCCLLLYFTVGLWTIADLTGFIDFMLFNLKNQFDVKNKVYFEALAEILFQVKLQFPRDNVWMV